MPSQNHQHFETGQNSARSHRRPHAVLRHTDRRETKGTPNAWFPALLKVSPVRAIELLCREFGRELGQMSWMAERAQQDVLSELRDLADPMLLDSLWETLLLDIEYENAGAEVADERLHPLERLVAGHPGYVKERFVRLSAEVFNDARHYRDDAVARLQAFARKHGLAMPWTATVDEKRDRQTPRGQGTHDAQSPFRPIQPPAFPPSPSFVDILTSIRRLSQQQLPSENLAELVSLPLSYLITEMVDRGEEVQVQRLLHFLVHETPYWTFERAHPIALLAQSLDSAGHVRVAALALTLAFTSSRGGGGFLNFGDRTQTPALQRAIDLDKDLALQTLAEETARRVRSGGFSGLTKHLIEQISDWGDHEIAAQAWEEAFTVLASRLRLPGPRTLFEPFDPGDVVAWTVDEALAGLLLSRIGNASLPRKIAALSGLARLLQDRPDLFAAPLEWLLTRDATVSTVQAVLQILVDTPTNTVRTIVALEQVLQGYARGNAWTLSWLAEKLLMRAGRPFAVTRTRPKVSVAAPSKEGLALTGYADVGDVLKDLEDLWPDLPAIVARRMCELTVGNEDFKQVAGERARLTFGRARDILPAAVVSWPTELLMPVLDEALMGLYEHLWEHGLWDPEIEEQVASRVLPDSSLHLALSASRVPRPDWSPANEAQDQLGDIVRVPDEDATYGRWVRLAIFEQRFFRSDDRDYLRPDRSALISAAVVHTELNGSVPARATPMPSGDAGWWWHDISTREAMVASSRPQLIQAGRVTDWLGGNIALIPPVALRHRARLLPPGYCAPLQWHDVDGKPAVVLRTWRVRGRDSDTEGHTTLGCDLLMRPDLFDVLEQAYEGGPLKDLQRVRLRNIEVPGEETPQAAARTTGSGA